MIEKMFWKGHNGLGIVSVTDFPLSRRNWRACQ